MNSKLSLASITALFGLVSLTGQALIFVATGGHAVGQQLEQMRGELALLRKDLQAEAQLFEYRLSRLEEKKPQRPQDVGN